MKLSLGTLRLNMASKVVLTVFALGLIARIDTAGAGPFGRRAAVAKAAPTQTVDAESEAALLSKADFFAAMARTGTALVEPGADRVAAAVDTVSETDAILDEFDLEAQPDDNTESCESEGCVEADESPCGPSGAAGYDDDGNPICDLGC